MEHKTTFARISAYTTYEDTKAELMNLLSKHGDNLDWQLHILKGLVIEHEAKMKQDHLGDKQNGR